MKINGAKIGIFVAGAAVGAVISAIVTRNVVDETYRKAADEEIYKAWQESKARAKKYQDKIADLEEKVTQQSVTIKTLADQVRRTGGVPVEHNEEDSDDETEDDPRSTVYTGKRETVRGQYERYASRYQADEIEFPRDDDEYHQEEAELEEENIRKSGPVVITEDQFSTTCMDYGKEDLRYFLYDGKILSEYGEYLDNYAGIIGEDWKLHGHERAGEEIYVRNDRLQADYRIIFTAGAGESNVNMSDIWDD